MSVTVQQQLDIANITHIASDLQRFRDVNATGDNNTGDADLVTDRATQGFGSIMRSLVQRVRTRSGLTSQATHTHDVASTIHAVQSPLGTPLAIISGGAPAAGQVRLEPSPTGGRATLTFPAAVTTYVVHESHPLPHNILAVLDGTV